MIRFATEKDINGIISLWSEAFGDSEREIRFFLDNKFKPENTLIYEICGEAVSMLFLLEGNMIINGAEYPSYYLYAACTAKKCRGRGIMAELLEKAKLLASERNKCFICLMPGEKTLFDFYERFGYKTVFTRKKLYIKAADLTDYKSENNKFKFSDYYEKRNFAFSRFNRFEWDNDSIEFACKSQILYGGGAMNLSKGYALYNKNESGITVKEFAFAECDFSDALNYLFEHTNSDYAVVYLPLDYQTDYGKFEIEFSAMAISVNPEYDYLVDEFNNAYLGLTLD